jgi:predicted transcriptional regulator
MELKGLLKREDYRMVLGFFHENPAAVDTARGIATWTNQETSKVMAVLRKLTSLGILIEHKASSTSGYSYTQNKKKIAMVEKMLKD